MKITNTLLVLAALGCASHIEAFSIGSGIGGLLQSTGDNVKNVGDMLLGHSKKASEQTDQKSEENSLQAVTDNINKATDTLQDALNKAKDQTEQVTGKLQDAAKKVEDNVKETVENIQENVDKEVNELTKKAESEGVGVTECKQLANTIRDAVSTTLKGTASCISQTTKKAKDIITKVFTSAGEKLKGLKDVQQQIKECPSGSPSIIVNTVYAACRTSLRARTALLAAVAVPATIKDLVFATKDLATLPLTLTFCASKAAIGNLNEQSRKVINNVKQCIAEKTGKKQ